MFKLTSKRFTPQKLLGMYWLIIIITFFVYVLAVKMAKGISFQILLKKTPGIAIVFLIVSMLIFQLLLLIYVTTISNSKKGNAGKFYLFMSVQQLMVLNFIGACLSFCAYKSLKKYETLEKRDFLLLGGCGLIGVLSIVVLLIII
ncbi:hypothetical protein [Pediococcus acidilactici]|uniref:hypothetical protein n=1 Tax=Pediococcus acidilactici TaxID=1254 RepID=UPI001950B4C3|nr:hypothetical protein [Pediococcus acidilactici]MBM6585014.1 hypothetical protein [Pediococcus acidilactici]